MKTIPTRQEDHKTITAREGLGYYKLMKGLITFHGGLMSSCIPYKMMVMVSIPSKKNKKYLVKDPPVSRVCTTAHRSGFTWNRKQPSNLTENGKILEKLHRRRMQMKMVVAAI